MRQVVSSRETVRCGLVIGLGLTKWYERGMNVNQMRVTYVELSKVKRPIKHIIGHIGDGFMGERPNQQCQSTEGREVLRTRLQSH